MSESYLDDTVIVALIMFFVVLKDFIGVCNINQSSNENKRAKALVFHVSGVNEKLIACSNRLSMKF